MSDDDGFLSRWARRKSAVRSGQPVAAEPVTAAAPTAAQSPSAVAAATAAPSPAEVPAPTLADVAALAPGDEVSRFVARGVDEGVRRAAMKKLFADPHFNLMDGLDTYIDDYSLPDPIPMAMLRQLNQAKAMGLFDAEEAAEAKAAAEAEAATAAAEATPPDADADADADAASDTAPPESAPPALSSPDEAAPGALPQATHEDPDLQLQPDAAAGWPGAATRARIDRG